MRFATGQFCQRLPWRAQKVEVEKFRLERARQRVTSEFVASSNLPGEQQMRGVGAGFYGQISSPGRCGEENDLFISLDLNWATRLIATRRLDLKMTDLVSLYETLSAPGSNSRRREESDAFNCRPSIARPSLLYLPELWRSRPSN